MSNTWAFIKLRFIKLSRAGLVLARSKIKLCQQSLCINVQQLITTPFSKVHNISVALVVQHCLQSVLPLQANLQPISKPTPHFYPMSDFFPVIAIYACFISTHKQHRWLIKSI